MQRTVGLLLAIFLIATGATRAQRYTTSDGRLRVALAKQPFSPTEISAGPNTMANGGIKQILEGMGATLRIDEAALTPSEATEYGAWKRLGMALGHFAEIVTKNERDGYFTVGLLATCPSMPGLVAGAHLDPPLQDRHIVMADVRLTDPLEQQLLDRSSIQQLSVDDLRNMTPAVFAQLDRLSRLTRPYSLLRQ
jgi:hypothetical protein